MAVATAGHDCGVVESVPAPPAGWIRDEGAKLDKDSHMVKLRIHLSHQNMDKFHDMALKVSSCKYRS